MGFGQAISTCLSNYANFNGRARRSEFWWFWLFVVIVQVVVQTLFAVIVGTDSALYSLLAFVLAIVLAITGGYYLVASLIFPDDPEDWPDFDLWYERQKHMVIGGLLSINIVTMIATSILDALRPVPQAPPGPAGEVGFLIYGLGAMALFMLLIALFFVRNRPSNVAMLAALNLILLGTSILEDFI